MNSSQSPSVSYADANNRSGSESMSQQDMNPGQDLLDYVKTYARDKPEVAAMWCFGIGFIVGWKLKPW